MTEFCRCCFPFHPHDSFCQQEKFSLCHSYKGWTTSTDFVRSFMLKTILRPMFPLTWACINLQHHISLYNRASRSCSRSSWITFSASCCRRSFRAKTSRNFLNDYGCILSIYMLLMHNEFLPMFNGAM